MSGVAREAMEDVAPAPGVGEFGVASCGVLLASVVGVIFGPTGLVISSFSLFIEPIAADLDWDRGQSALPVTLLGLAVALSSPLKGWLVDRWGARALVLPLTAALALCLASLALARSGWQLYLLFALLGLLTPGNIPYARILGGWFERRRGAAYGILGLGFGVGGPLALYLGSACIDAFGWRATFLVYGLLEGLLALPLLYALFRERPGDLPQALRPPADALPGATPGQAWRSADFWLIVGNLILGVFAVTGVMVHGVPLLQERGPDGIGGELFFQKHAARLKIPGIVQLDPALDPGHPPLLQIRSAEALVGAVQMGSIEFHTWNASLANLERPDRFVLDLDPDPALPWKRMLEATQLSLTLLDELGLRAFLKTSGGKGMHLLVPLERRHGWDEVKDFAQAISQHLARLMPERFSAVSGPRNRVGKIFVDYLRNSRGASTVAAYSVRAREGLPVSVPVFREELDSLQGANQWNLRSLPQRLDELAGDDPWADYAGTRQRISAAMRRQLGRG